MRKILAICCVTSSLAVGGLLIYNSYRVTQFQTDTKLAMLVFIPSFIVLYWLGLLYDHLSVKDGKAVIRKPYRKILKGIYLVNLLVVLAVWIYVLYNHTYFFGNMMTRNVWGGDKLWQL